MYLKKCKLQHGNRLETACLRVAQVIRESLQFICSEVVVIAQHNVMHRMAWPLHCHNHPIYIL